MYQVKLGDCNQPATFQLIVFPILPHLPTKLIMFVTDDFRQCHIYILVKNKPPRKAVAENLGTFMPICCFSLIFLSVLYTPPFPPVSYRV